MEKRHEIADSLKDFGRNLRKVRMAKKLTLEIVAERARSLTDYGGSSTRVLGRNHDSLTYLQPVIRLRNIFTVEYTG